MSVWNSIVGQAQVVEQLKAIASGDPKAIAQSWLICGPPGSGRSNVARAFAAALESPDHGLNDEPTKTTEQVLAGTHPDVSVLATNKVTIGIDEVRDIITTSEQMPGTAPADDRLAVTTPTGQVRGVAGLRVCDAALMPAIPCANTNIPTIMIAERIADFIRQGR